MRQQNGLTLLAWMLVGAGLRFWQLDTKTPWSDEWATLVFSLGHSFTTIPLDQLLSLDELLAIARLGDTSPWDGLTNVWRYLMAESTHPPLYFWLTHLWLRLWQAPGELVQLGIARSLSAWLGVAGIPAAYGLGYWVMADCRKAQRHRVGWLAAALMALSPFGVYLAQEARHYTMAVLWVMASLGCFVAAWRSLRKPVVPMTGPPMTGPLTTGLPLAGASMAEPWREPLSWPVVLLWMAANGLGLATHYFVGLLVAAEGLALLGLLMVQGRSQGLIQTFQRHRRLAIKLTAVAVGALLAALPWLPFWLNIPGDRLTAWIQRDASWLERGLMPLLRLAAWLASMVMLLPVEQVSIGIVVLSGLGLLAALLWLLPQLAASLNRQVRQQVKGQTPAVEALLAVQGAGLALVLAAIYIWQKDLSLATRYFFVFLPGIVLLGALALTELNRPRATALLLALGFAGSAAVTTGYAFQKPDRPDLLVQTIRSEIQANAPQSSIVMSTFNKTHEQLSEMLSVAWELGQQGNCEANRLRKTHRPPNSPSDGQRYCDAHFLIALRKTEIALNTLTFQQALETHKRPFFLWESNLTMAVDFSVFACNAITTPFHRVPGYRVRGYLCPVQDES